MGIFKAAAVQMRSGMDPRRNAADMERMVREAAAQGATYVQTPEMTGAVVRDKAGRDAAFTIEDKDIIVATYPSFAPYEAKSGRRIAVARLIPTA